jgi:hypothetical protein
LNRPLGGFEAGLGVRTVAEWLVGRSATAAERHGLMGFLVLVSVRVCDLDRTDNQYELLTWAVIFVCPAMLFSFGLCRLKS